MRIYCGEFVTDISGCLSFTFYCPHVLVFRSFSGFLQILLSFNEKNFSFIIFGSWVFDVKTGFIWFSQIFSQTPKNSRLLSMLSSLYFSEVSLISSKIFSHEQSERWLFSERKGWSIELKNSLSSGIVILRLLSWQTPSQCAAL